MIQLFLTQSARVELIVFVTSDYLIPLELSKMISGNAKFAFSKGPSYIDLGMLLAYSARVELNVLDLHFTLS